MVAGRSRASKALTWLYALALILSLLITVGAVPLLLIVSAYTRPSRASTRTILADTKGGGIAIFVIAFLSFLYDIGYLIARRAGARLSFFSIATELYILGVIFLAAIITVGVFTSVGLGWVRDTTNSLPKAKWSQWEIVSPTASAVAGVGWLWVAVLLGTLLFESIYTLIHYGRSPQVWKRSFDQVTQKVTPGEYPYPEIDKTEVIPMIDGYSHSPYSGGEYEPQAPTYEEVMADDTLNMTMPTFTPNMGASSSASASSVTDPTSNASNLSAGAANRTVSEKGKAVSLTAINRV